MDESGASFAVGALAAGAALPGTVWVKLDATRMKTKGGLVHEYGAGGLLSARYWASDPYPRLRTRTATVAGALRITSPRAVHERLGVQRGLHARATTRTAGSPPPSIAPAGARSSRGMLPGRLASARDALDLAKGWPGFRYTYLGGQLASLTNSEGERTDYAWESARLTAATQAGPGSPASRFQYEGRDDAGVYHTRSWTPLGEERRYAYDALGRLLERSDVASGERTTWTWSGERIASRTLPNGATTTWAWQDDDVRIRTEPSGNVVAFSYLPSGVDRENPHMRPISSISDSLGSVESRSYDAAGRLVEQRNGAGDVTRYAWTQGALSSETSRGVTRTFSQYGEHGHAERVAAFGMTEVRAFDAVGNLLRGSDGGTPIAGGVELRAFDADRNLAAVTLQASGAGFGPLTIQLEHRSDGQTTRVLRGGDDHELVYDAFGRLAEQRERVGGVWQITRLGRDAAGRLTSIERPNGMREEASYGPSDRVAGVRRLRGGALESTLALGYQDGALVRVDDSASGVERYAYDAAGRLVTTTFAGGERLLTGYDLRSRVHAESFIAAAGGALVTLLYEHDLADRRVRVADAAGALQLTTFSDGRLAEQRTGNGLVRTFSYRADGLFTGATTRNASGALVEQTTLEHQLEMDEAGVPGIRQRATTLTSGGVDVITVEEYVLAPAPAAGLYPPGARIVSWNDGLTSPESYTFDAKSNLRAFGDTQLGYNAEGNRLLSVSRGGQTVGSYAWDAAGFATARNGVPLAWNAAGRLVAHGADTLGWDGLGRLRATHIGGRDARFLFGGRVSADAAGAPVALDLGGVLVGFGGAHRYRHLDFRGNVKFVTDDAGAVVAHYRYAPFGLDAVFGADDDPVRFVARAEVGALMLLGARVYDPGVGRFLSPDPVFQIVNQFAYTLGNPVWFDDADGLSVEANDSAQGVADGLSIAGAALAVVGRILSFAPTPQTVILGNALALLGAMLILLGVAIRTSSKAAVAPAASSPGGGGPGSGGGGGGGPGCSPAALAALPDVHGWLPVLLPLQLLLGWLLLRRRRREEGGA